MNSNLLDYFLDKKVYEKAIKTLDQVGILEKFKHHEQELCDLLKKHMMDEYGFDPASKRRLEAGLIIMRFFNTFDEEMTKRMDAHDFKITSGEKGEGNEELMSCLFAAEVFIFLSKKYAQKHM